MEQANELEKKPGTSGVLETALYVDNLQTAERFYCDILGLPKIFAVPGRQLVFRCEDSILLIFDPTHTQRNQMTINGGAIPLHGTRGAGHMAFRVSKEQLNTWREHLRDKGVAIESEVSWPNGAHSIYFRDPAGNSLEFATPEIWEIS
jgi:catechol 2,3-dioxygenase-like lactoylglutathione lyase family enzyme